MKQADAERRRLARIDAQMQHMDASEQRGIASVALPEVVGIIKSHSFDWHFSSLII